MATAPDSDDAHARPASFFEERTAVAQALVERYRTATVPLFGDRGKRLPDLLGGSVLFMANGWVFLLTAAHVLDALEGETIDMSTPPTFTRLRDWPGVRHDESDAAVLQVPSHLVTVNMVERAVTLGDLDLSQHPPGEWFALLGSPPKLFKVVAGNTTQMRPGCWTGHNAGDDDYAACGRWRERDLVVEYDADGAYDEHGGKRRSIFFKGVSGSGIWRLPLEGARDVNGRPGQLAAIFTDYKQKCIIGTRVGVHLQLVREMHPFVLPTDV
jgi:hypothetical protein